jgi:hypothetical protein
LLLVDACIKLAWMSYIEGECYCEVHACICRDAYGSLERAYTGWCLSSFTCTRWLGVRIAQSNTTPALQQLCQAVAAALVIMVMDARTYGQLAGGQLQADAFFASQVLSCMSLSLMVTASMTKGTHDIVAASHTARCRAHMLACASTLPVVLHVAYVLLLLYFATLRQPHAATAAILQHHMLTASVWSTAYATLH